MWWLDPKYFHIWTQPSRVPPSRGLTWKFTWRVSDSDVFPPLSSFLFPFPEVFFASDFSRGWHPLGLTSTASHWRSEALFVLRTNYFFSCSVFITALFPCFASGLFPISFCSFFQNSYFVSLTLTPAFRWSVPFLLRLRHSCIFFCEMPFLGSGPKGEDVP